MSVQFIRGPKTPIKRLDRWRIEVDASDIAQTALKTLWKWHFKRAVSKRRPVWARTFLNPDTAMKALEAVKYAGLHGRAYKLKPRSYLPPRYEPSAASKIPSSDISSFAPCTMPQPKPWARFAQWVPNEA